MSKVSIVAILAVLAVFCAQSAYGQTVVFYVKYHESSGLPMQGHKTACTAALARIYKYLYEYELSNITQAGNWYTAQVTATLPEYSSCSEIQIVTDALLLYYFPAVFNKDTSNRATSFVLKSWGCGTTPQDLFPDTTKAVLQSANKLGGTDTVDNDDDVNEVALHSILPFGIGSRKHDSEFVKMVTLVATPPTGYDGNTPSSKRRSLLQTDTYVHFKIQAMGSIFTGIPSASDVLQELLQGEFKVPFIKDYTIDQQWENSVKIISALYNCYFVPSALGYTCKDYKHFTANLATSGMIAKENEPAVAKLRGTGWVVCDTNPTATY